METLLKKLAEILEIELSEDAEQDTQAILCAVQKLKDSIYDLEAGIDFLHGHLEKKNQEIQDLQAEQDRLVREIRDKEWQRWQEAYQKGRRRW